MDCTKATAYFIRAKPDPHSGRIETCILMRRKKSRLDCSIIDPVIPFLDNIGKNGTIEA